MTAREFVLLGCFIYSRQGMFERRVYIVSGELTGFIIAD